VFDWDAAVNMYNAFYSRWRSGGLFEGNTNPSRTNPSVRLVTRPRYERRTSRARDQKQWPFPSNQALVQFSEQLWVRNIRCHSTRSRHKHSLAKVASLHGKHVLGSMGGFPRLYWANYMPGRRTGLITSLRTALGHELRLYGPTNSPKIVSITAAQIIIIIIIIITLRQYLSNISGQKEIKELQKTATLGTAHANCGKC